MSNIPNTEKRKIIKKLREYQNTGAAVAMMKISVDNVYRWSDILYILMGGPYELTTYEMIDRIIDLIDPGDDYKFYDPDIKNNPSFYK